MPATGGATSVLGSVSILVAGTLVLGGALVYDAGAIRVRVQEKSPGGEHINLLVPAVAVPVALKFVPDEKLHEASAEIRPWLPAIKIAAEELAHCPDGPFVEVTSPHEKVRIAKRGGSLVIDVDDTDATVQVSFPVRVVSSVVQELEMAGPPV